MLVGMGVRAHTTVLLAVALLGAVAPAGARPASPALLSDAAQVALAGGRLVAPVDGTCVGVHGSPTHASAYLTVPARTGDGRWGLAFCGGPVLAVRPGWARVRIEPQRAGGPSRVGWSPVGTSALTIVPYRVVVHRDRHEALVLAGGRVVRRIAVGVGAPGTPTTLGATHVTARLRFTPGQLPYAVYGPRVLALGLPASDGPGQSPRLRGRGVLAFHAGAGGAASHGCLHASAQDLAWMFGHLPAGTPVDIVR